jgi:4-hydroxyphenylacetaldehyde oxime monooxygenase
MDEHVYSVSDGIIGTVAFGSVYGAATFAGRYQRCQHMLDEAMDVLSGFSAEDFFPNTVGRLADQLVGTVAWWESVFEDLDAFFEAVIEQRMDTKPEDNYGGGLVDALVSLWKQGARIQQGEREGHTSGRVRGRRRHELYIILSI